MGTEKDKRDIEWMNNMKSSVSTWRRPPGWYTIGLTNRQNQENNKLKEKISNEDRHGFRFLKSPCPFTTNCLCN